MYHVQRVPTNSTNFFAFHPTPHIRHWRELPTGNAIAAPGGLPFPAVFVGHPRELSPEL